MPYALASTGSICSVWNLTTVGFTILFTWSHFTLRDTRNFTRCCNLSCACPFACISVYRDFGTIIACRKEMELQ